MARGRDLHHAHQAAVAALGKSLTRRAGSRCELCEAETDLRVIEVPPTGDEPAEDAALLGCGRCRELIAGGKLPREHDPLRFVEGAVWSEVMPVQLAAIRLLRQLAAVEVPWAREALDTLWISEELEARL